MGYDQTFICRSGRYNIYVNLLNINTHTRMCAYICITIVVLETSDDANCLFLGKDNKRENPLVRRRGCQTECCVYSPPVRGEKYLFRLIREEGVWRKRKGLYDINRNEKNFTSNCPVVVEYLLYHDCSRHSSRKHMRKSLRRR